MIPVDEDPGEDGAVPPAVSIDDPSWEPPADGALAPPTASLNLPPTAPYSANPYRTAPTRLVSRSTRGMLLLLGIMVMCFSVGGLILVSVWPIPTRPVVFFLWLLYLLPGLVLLGAGAYTLRFALRWRRRGFG
jgi:hypothetical protein